MGIRTLIPPKCFSTITLISLYLSATAGSHAGPSIEDQLRAAQIALAKEKGDNAKKEAENRMLRAELANARKPAAKKAETSTTSAAHAATIVSATATPPAPPPYGTILLRKDNLEASDILFQNTLQQTSDAKGANFNWTNNYIQKTNNFATQSYLTWAIPALHHGDNTINPNGVTVDNAVIAPFSYLNGSLTNPYNPKTEKSAAQFGLNGEVALITPGPINLTSFSLLPYYQTDFRGHASIEGIQALVEPYSHKWHLGSEVTTGDPELFDWYWRLIGEANPIWVANSGLTSFTSHTTYALLGGIGQLRGTLFANMPSVGDALCGRISVLGSFQPMWNVSNHAYLNNIHTELDYELAGKKSRTTLHCGANSTGQDTSPKSFYESQSFDASLSLNYDTGVDLSTYQKTNKFMLGLTLLY
jgi:hypothetical protein